MQELVFIALTPVRDTRRPSPKTGEGDSPGPKDVFEDEGAPDNDDTE